MEHRPTSEGGSGAFTVLVAPRLDCNLGAFAGGTMRAILVAPGGAFTGGGEDGMNAHLVTGTTGFIRSPVAERLRARCVVCLWRSVRMIGPKVRFVSASFCTLV